MGNHRTVRGKSFGTPFQHDPRAISIISNFLPSQPFALQSLSARTLRRLPAMALAMHAAPNHCHLHDALDALDVTVRKELDTSHEAAQGERRIHSARREREDPLEIAGRSASSAPVSVRNGGRVASEGLAGSECCARVGGVVIAG